MERERREEEWERVIRRRGIKWQKDKETKR